MITPSWQVPLSTSQNRWALTPQKLDDSVKPGVKRFELWVPPDLKEIPATLYTISENEVGRLDNLAYKFYGNVNLWWVIAYANNIKNSFEDMSPGDVLQIPDIQAVEARIVNSMRRT